MIKGSALPIIPAASANQTITNTVACQKLAFSQWDDNEYCCVSKARVAGKLERSSRGKDWWFSEQTLQNRLCCTLSDDVWCWLQLDDRLHSFECWNQTCIIDHSAINVVPGSGQNKSLCNGDWGSSGQDLWCLRLFSLSAGDRQSSVSFINLEHTNSKAWKHPFCFIQHSHTSAC